MSTFPFDFQVVRNSPITLYVTGAADDYMSGYEIYYIAVPRGSSSPNPTITSPKLVRKILTTEPCYSGSAFAGRGFMVAGQKAYPAKTQLTYTVSNIYELTFDEWNTDNDYYFYVGAFDKWNNFVGPSGLIPYPTNPVLLPPQKDTTNKAIYFSGLTNSVIDVAANSKLSTNIFTIECLISPFGASTDPARVISRENNSSSSPNWRLEYTPNLKKISFKYYDGAVQTVGSVDCVSGEIYHVVGTFKGTSPYSASLTINNVTTTSTPTSSFVSDASIGFGIGNRPTSALTHGFQGVIDYVRFYSGVLSSADITTLYNNVVISGKVNYDPTSWLTSSPIELVGWWKMNAGTGTTVVDSSSNSLNGTMKNCRWLSSGLVWNPRAVTTDEGTTPGSVKTWVDTYIASGGNFNPAVIAVSYLGASATDRMFTSSTIKTEIENFDSAGYLNVGVVEGYSLTPNKLSFGTQGVNLLPSNFSVFEVDTCPTATIVGYASAILDPTQFLIGSKSLKLPGGSPQCYIALVDDVHNYNLRRSGPKAIYSLAFYALASVSNAQLDVEVYDDAATLVAIDSFNISSTTTWTRYSLNFDTNGFSDTFQVLLKGDDTDDIWVDYITVTEISDLLQTDPPVMIAPATFNRSIANGSFENQEILYKYDTNTLKTVGGTTTNISPSMTTFSGQLFSSSGVRQIVEQFVYPPQTYGGNLIPFRYSFYNSDSPWAYSGMSVSGNASGLVGWVPVFNPTLLATGYLTFDATLDTSLGNYSLTKATNNNLLYPSFMMCSNGSNNNSGILHAYIRTPSSPYITTFYSGIVNLQDATWTRITSASGIYIGGTPQLRLEFSWIRLKTPGVGAAKIQVDTPALFLAPSGYLTSPPWIFGSDMTSGIANAHLKNQNILYASGTNNLYKLNGTVAQIGSGMIVDGNITGIKIANNAIDDSKIINTKLTYAVLSGVQEYRHIWSSLSTKTTDGDASDVEFTRTVSGIFAIIPFTILSKDTTFKISGQMKHAGGLGIYSNMTVQICDTVRCFAPQTVASINKSSYQNFTNSVTFSGLDSGPGYITLTLGPSVPSTAYAKYVSVGLGDH